MDLDTDLNIGVGGDQTVEMIRLEAQPLRLSRIDGTRRYLCDFVVAGRVRRRDGGRSNWVVTREALQGAVDKFNGVAVFLNHPGFLDSGRDVRDLAGITEDDARFESDRLRGTIRLYQDSEAGALCAALFDQILEGRDLGEPVPDVGLSAVFWHKAEYVDDDKLTTEFTHVESVDVVFGPGARGAVRAALQAVNSTGAKPQGGNTMSEERTNNTAQTPVGGGDGAPPAAPAPPVAAPTAPQPGPTLNFSGLSPDQMASLQRTNEKSQQLLVSQCQNYLSAQLQLLSGQLPQASIQHLQREFQGKVFAAPELERAVEQQRRLVADLAQAGTIRGMGVTEGSMLNELDQVTLAFEKLMGLDVKEQVRPLTGIKELYLMLTGDRYMRGMFNPEYAQLSYTTSSTMAEVCRNVLNKVMMNQWTALGEAGYRWWERIVHEEDFPTLQDISWVCTDGFGDLSTVTEGSAFAEISWDDDRETASFIKKGGFVGLTLEMIDKDDIGAWKAVPRGLAVAGIRTLSAAVSAIFTDNSGTGPSLNDSNYLFDATNHSNLITHFLDADNWDIAVQSMFEQSEAGSSKTLALRPKYLLVPIELEKRGRQVLGSNVEPVSGVMYENVRKTAMDNVITVPEWTDEDNWAAVADPVIAPGIGIGYRFGRVPELFTVTDPRMGLMFTNDVLPIKVRFFYAVGVINYRALLKSNVA
jgi:hypothetical protein